MKVLTIQRSTWQRGEHPDTALLNAAGKMCCLGFDAIACGLPAHLIESEGEPCCIQTSELMAFPDYLRSPRFVADAWGDYNQSTLIDRAIKHNDNPDISEPEREQLIREDLIALGWDDVQFVD